MVDGYLSLPELAEQLGVPPGTIDEWIRHLDLDVPKTNEGGLLFPPELIPLFETVRNLRTRDRSYGTIQKVIGPKRADDELDAIFSPEQLLPTMEKVTQLAQDYAKATYRIGQLEARIGYLEEQLNQERVAHRQAREDLRQTRDDLRSSQANSRRR